jgi:hypothetical protein
MTDVTPPKADRLSEDHDKGPNPNPNPGGEVDTGDSLIPPYDGRSTESTNSRDVEAMAHSRDVTHEQGAASGEATSDRDIQSPSDFPPDGVGESAGRRGEDIRADDGKEAGRHDEGTKGQTDRPEGTSDDRDKTGI